MIKKNLFIFISIISVMFIVTSCTNASNIEVIGKQDIAIGIIGDNKTMERAVVSKMLALLNNSKDDIISYNNQINFKDVEPNEWYYKYVNATFINGDMNGVLEDEFRPLDNLTITQTQYLIDKYDDTKKIQIDNENQDKPVSYALWCEIYKQLSEDKGIIEETIIILATKDDINALAEGYAITDKGLMNFEGFYVNDYLNKEIKILRKDKEVVAITEIVSNTPTLNRVLVLQNGINYIDIYIEGITKRLFFQNLILNENSQLADIKINGNNIEAIEYYHETVSGVITMVTDELVSIDNINYVTDENFKIYSTNNSTPSFYDNTKLIIGQSSTTFYKKGNENKIYGAILENDITLDKVRVAINNNSFDNLYFESMQFYSEYPIKILISGKELSSNEINIKTDNDFGLLPNDVLILESSNKETPIILSNLTRGYDNVEFYGTLEIRKVQDKYTLINVIDTEYYIASVISSDGNNYREEELLKLMSVLYRTELAYYIGLNELRNMGANVDDSKNYQLFNNLPATENNIQMAELTKGEIITSSGEPINALYFDYSSGTSGNSGEVWADTKTNNYPAQSESYLLHKKFFDGVIYDNLSDEIDSNIFFKSKDIDFIERESDWFRWCSTLEMEHINFILENISNLYENNKKFILTSNEVFSKEIGDIKDFNVLERGEGGNVMKLEIVGTTATITVMTEEIISKIFSPTKTINNKGNSVNLEYIPSCYFVADKIFNNSGNLESLVLYGGGYGHGVGMSLYGAVKMALSGETYLDILNAYYSNISIKTSTFKLDM